MTLRTVANRYELEEEIGRGGMAVVYRARDLSLNRSVAFKLLHPYLANDAENAVRFHREAEAIAKLHHPNIVEIFDTGRDEETGSQYLVMELLEGPTLNQFIQQHQTVIPETALTMCCSLCDAVEHAHQANIIHRDIKPENIMFSKDGVLKLMDFGIARVLDNDRMTASNTLIGSPAYMSPETIENHEFTFLCDIYSLGTVLYYALTGKLPFSGTSTMAILKNILDNTYPPPGRINQSISKKIDRIVAKCLKPKPEDRYQSAAELREALTNQLKLVHFENYSEILASYYTNPDVFNQTQLPRVKSNLNEAAQIAVREKQVATALEHLNTILSYDPENELAIALLKKLRTGDLVKKRIIAGVFFFFILLGVVVVFFVSKREPEPQISDFSVIRHEEYLTPKNDIDIAEKPSSEPAKEAVIAQNKEEHTESAPTVLETAHAMAPAVQPSTSENTPDQASETTSLQQAETQENTPHTAAETELHRPNHPRPQTPKRVNKQNGSDKDAQAQNNDKPNAPDEEAQTESEPVKEFDTVQLTQPVFPPDAYAFIAGKRYNSNANGDIQLNLQPGQYAMTVTCKTRCVPQKTMLIIDSNAKNTTREVIPLAWADATVTVSSQNDDLYYVAVVLDEQGRFTKQFDYLIPGKPMSYNNFTPLGNKPIRLEVFAISKEKKIQGINKSILEKEKSASTRIELLPGDNRSVTF